MTVVLDPAAEQPIDDGVEHIADCRDDYQQDRRLLTEDQQPDKRGLRLGRQDGRGDTAMALSAWLASEVFHVSGQRSRGHARCMSSIT
jgi:hypothetical protein